MTVIILISLWIATVVGWVIYNLYNKNVKLEEILRKHSKFVNDVIGLAEHIEKTVQKIDSVMWTNGDPELTALMEDVKLMQQHIHDFTSRK